MGDTNNPLAPRPHDLIKKPKAPQLLLSLLLEAEVGDHLCLLKSKSNTLPWQFLSGFLLPQHSAVAWLKQMPLTFH